MRYIYIALLGTSLFITSCARSITSQILTLNMQVTLTFRENVDLSTVNYLLIFSPVSSPAIALPPDNKLGGYFPTPGRDFLIEDPTFADTYDETGITSFYEDYFYTWSDYIVVHDGTPYLYQSGSTGFSKTTTENLSYDYSRNLDYSLIVSGKNLILNFDISILESDLKGTRHFTFATTKISDGSQTGHLLDTLTNPQEIDIVVNSDESLEEPVEEDIDGASDIVAWRVQLL
jgi:hypothetical protein